MPAIPRPLQMHTFLRTPPLRSLARLLALNSHTDFDDYNYIGNNIYSDNDDNNNNSSDDNYNDDNNNTNNSNIDNDKINDNDNIVIILQCCD